MGGFLGAAPPPQTPPAPQIIEVIPIIDVAREAGVS
jgi:hypothetical protein